MGAKVPCDIPNNKDLANLILHLSLLPQILDILFPLTCNLDVTPELHPVLAMFWTCPKHCEEFGNHRLHDLCQMCQIMHLDAMCLKSPAD